VNKQRLVVYLLIFTVLSLILSGSALAYSTNELTISPLQERGYKWNLHSNDKITGTLMITQPVKVAIRGPNDYIIQNLGRIEQNTPFEIIASTDGEYSVTFLNPNMDNVNVQITYDYKQPDLQPLPSGHILTNSYPELNFNGSLLWSIVFVLVAIVVIFVVSITVISRVRTRKRTKQSDQIH
jgi:hypothetical protein